MKSIESNLRITPLNCDGPSGRISSSNLERGSTLGGLAGFFGGALGGFGVVTGNSLLTSGFSSLSIVAGIGGVAVGGVGGLIGAGVAYSVTKYGLPKICKIGAAAIRASKRTLGPHIQQLNHKLRGVGLAAEENELLKNGRARDKGNFKTLKSHILERVTDAVQNRFPAGSRASLSQERQQEIVEASRECIRRCSLKLARHIRDHGANPPAGGPLITAGPPASINDARLERIAQRALTMLGYRFDALGVKPPFVNSRMEFDLGRVMVTAQERIAMRGGRSTDRDNFRDIKNYLAAEISQRIDAKWPPATRTRYPAELKAAAAALTIAQFDAISLEIAKHIKAKGVDIKAAMPARDLIQSGRVADTAIECIVQRGVSNIIRGIESASKPAPKPLDNGPIELVEKDLERRSVQLLESMRIKFPDCQNSVQQDYDALKAAMTSTAGVVKEIAAGLRNDADRSALFTSWAGKVDEIIKKSARVVNALPVFTKANAADPDPPIHNLGGLSPQFKTVDIELFSTYLQSLRDIRAGSSPHRLSAEKALAVLAKFYLPAEDHTQLAIDKCKNSLVLLDRLQQDFRAEAAIAETVAARQANVQSGIIAVRQQLDDAVQMIAKEGMKLIKALSKQPALTKPEKITRISDFLRKVNEGTDKLSRTISDQLAVIWS